MARTRIHTRVFDFVIFSNLFIASCALLMTWFTAEVFGLALSNFFKGFIFFSTLASYSIHWYLTDEVREATAQRTPWLSSNKKVHFFFFILSVTGSAIFLLREFQNFKWVLPAIVLTLMYTAPKIPLPFFIKLRRHIWGKTILLAAMWAYVTIALPLLVNQQQWSVAHWLFLFNRFTIIYTNCILFDIRDKAFDKQTGVKSIITFLDETKIKTIFDLIIIGSIVSAFSLYIYFDDALLIAILLIPAFLTYILYASAKKTLNDYLFYFILDGLMALSPILYFIEKLI